MSIRILIVVLITLSMDSNAQTCCTGGTPYLGALKLPVVQKHEFGLNLSYNYNQNKLLILEDQVISNSQNQRLVQSLLLQTDFGISDHVSVSFILPYLFQSERIEHGNDQTVIRNNGTGDISIGSNYKGKYRLHTLYFGLALKIPTGKTNSEDPETGFDYPLSFQVGSGSWDVIFNLYDDFPLGRKKVVFWINQFSGKINSKGQQFDAHPGYRFGHSFQYFSALSVRWLMGYALADLFLGFSYQYLTQDQFNGGYNNINTGGNWVYVHAGYNHQFTPKISIGFSGSIPIYQKVGGLQLTNAWKANATISYIL